MTEPNSIKLFVHVCMCVYVSILCEFIDIIKVCHQNNNSLQL